MSSTDVSRRNMSELKDTPIATKEERARGRYSILEYYYTKYDRLAVVDFSTELNGGRLLYHVAIQLDTMVKYGSVTYGDTLIEYFDTISLDTANRIARAME